MLKRFLAFALVSLMLAFCFAGCNNGNTDTPTDVPTDVPSDAPTDKAPVKTAVKVIYPKDGSKTPALMVQDAIMNLKGASLEMLGFCTLTSDDKTEDDGTFEILVGTTDRAISTEAKGMLTTYLDFAIIYKDNKIAINANNEARLIAAVEFALSKISLKDDKVVYSGGEKHLEVFTEYTMPNITIADAPIDSFNIVYPAKANNAEKKTAEQLADWLMSLCGKTIGLVDDSTAESANEILVGKTNRALSTEAAGEASLSEMQFSSIVKDGKLAINADAGSGYTEAIRCFKNAMTKSGGNITEAFDSRWLTFDEIIEISVGSPNIKIKDNAVEFYKATDEQMLAYPEGSNMRKNATGSSGVRLDFTTDSSTFAFKAASGNCYDLYINGEYITQITNATSKVFSTTLDTSNEENRVTLFFPSDGVGAISMVQLDYGATCERQKFDRKFLIIGDSITQAKHIKIDSSSFAHRISMHYNADSIIYGVGAGIFNAKILGNTPEFDPELIVVAFGTNDWARSYTAATIENNMKAFLDKLKELYPDAKIIGITPLWRKDAGEKKAITFDEACALIKSIYEEYGIPCVDGEAMMGHDDKFFADDVHPNDEGHKEYAKNLIEEINVFI
ncbi:MAG: SGNH/GDSL hydrolase family protein [Clostridia bacterium]|nr:SGNH/GDSL hydrolase family protein [Clostridia bacterium]